MKKPETRFLWTATAAVFLSLTILMGIINMVNFTMASEDADHITEMLAHRQGSFDQGLTAPDGSMPPQANESFPNGQDSSAFQNQPDDALKKDDRFLNGFPGRMGPMGPDSPETGSSMRYFTVSFGQNGEDAQPVAYKISAVTEEEALIWAKSLMNESTGWTHGTYRYRIYTQNDRIYVTVIDQGREMISCYRILIISGIGIAAGTLISFLILRLVSKKLFGPLEEADRRQRQFLAQAEKEFKVPLTVISADTELIERENGPSEKTRSIHRQVKQMNALVKDLGKLSIRQDEETLSVISLSNLLQEEIDHKAARLSAKGITFTTSIAPDIEIKADPQVISRMLDEITDNLVKYALTTVRFSLQKEHERVQLIIENDAALKAGSCDQVFDRFTKLSNAAEEEIGLGLSYVKDAILSLGGRISAEVDENSIFRLLIAL